MSGLLLVIYFDLGIELQNVLAAFPVFSCVFEVFPQPLFMPLFSSKFLLQAMC
jgi:hypothetical protein